jgi:hypothetical protein
MKLMNMRSVNIKPIRIIFTAFILLTGTNLMAITKACGSPEHRQFDFWIGDWEVKNAAGKIVGTNKITSILDGCALSENWTSAAGNPGVSTNFYDKKTKLWHQTWVDNSGGTLYLNGELVNGVMVLTDKADNNDSIQKISWTPLEDGKVKQHWESSKDNGRTWTDVFVGFYQKKDLNKAFNYSTVKLSSNFLVRLATSFRQLL